MSDVEIAVKIPGHTYRIRVGAGTLDRVGELVPPSSPGRRAAIVADRTTGRLFGRRVAERLTKGGWDVSRHSVAPGEGSKTLRAAGRLYGGLARARVDRGSTVFALGGGVVGDVAGFVAATYLRGIAFVPLPTTLLAQVDSSVGGKVAVDLPQGKNLVGAFHQPTAVVADPEVLRSLDARQVRAGFAEVVKHAAIADAELFAELETDAEALLALDTDRLAEVVARNCRIKASVVAQDPTERRGVRAVLNFGHTVGHALERGARSWSLLHGEAVAVGMVAEARAAHRLGLAEGAVVERLESLLGRLGLPATVTGDVNMEIARAALASDKKVVGGKLTSPVVRRIGAVELVDDLPIRELLTAMAEAV